MKLVPSIAAFVSLVLAASSALALDPSKQISQYGHKAWRIQDGFFSGTPFAITQTEDGYLWIGTTNELLRFDGVRFVAWTPRLGERPPSFKVTALLGARDGTLWIGTETGLNHWANQELVSYPDVHGRVTAIVERRNGEIWFSRFQRSSTGDGALCQVQGPRTRCYGARDGIPFDNGAGLLVEDSSGSLWTGDSTTVLKWQSGFSTAYKVEGLKSNASEGVMAVAPTPDGFAWVGIDRAGRGLGLEQLVHGVFKPAVTPGFDSSMLVVTALLLDRENSLWVGTEAQGIYRFRGGKVDRFHSSDGLSGDYIQGFYEDREGNLWVETTRGLDCFHDLRVTTFSNREGLGTEEIDSVLASRDGSVWAGGSGALARLWQEKTSSLQTGRGLPGNQVASLLEDHAGRLWVGIDNSLFIYANGKFSQVRKPNGGPIGFVVGMAEDADGSIWAETGGASRTLLRIKESKVQQEFPAPQFPAARKVAAAPDGTVWLGLTNGDLARNVNGKADVIHFEHGGPSDTTSSTNQLFIDSDGSVVGATSAGLIAWRNGKQQTLTVKNDLPCDNVHALITDSRKALWLYTQCGLVQITRAELDKWWEDRDAKLQTRTLDALDGAQSALAPFEAAARSTDGRLWFANGVVLQMIDPNHLAVNPFLPPVHVEEVIANRKRYAPQNDLSLPPIVKDLEIDYTALSFATPQKVRFRYKLEGRDVNWQEAGTRRQAFYSDLGPGKYRFHVMACNNDGVWNEAGVSLAFSIAPAWYETNWFRTLCIASGIFIAWVVHRLRVLQVARAISARSDERLAERTRMARELHDTFLQTIQGSKLVADDALDKSSDATKMRRALEQLSAWLERATQEGRAALNSLRASTTNKNDLAEAFRRATQSDSISASMAVTLSVVGDPREMHPIVRDEIYRIGYEAIRNAHAHSGGSRLEVALRYGHDLVLCIRDNGVGIDPTVSSRGKDNHFGLQGMRERAARIGGKLTIVSSAATGTEINVVVPGGIVFRRVKPNLIQKVKSIFERISRPSPSDS